MSALVTVTDEQAEAIRRRHGQSGTRWLEAWPDQLRTHCERWALTPLHRYDGGLYINVLLECERPDGSRVVLKAGMPEEERWTERVALGAFAGRHSVRLLESDADSGALLLEHLAPGRQLLKSIGEPAEAEVAAHLARDLPRPIPAQAAELPAFTDWFDRALADYRRQGLSSLDARRPEHAAELLADIATEPWQLIHGDLHHMNILECDVRGWLAIDPKGARGPAVLECGRFIHNHFTSADSDADVAAAVAGRTRTFAAVQDCQVQRIADVAFIDLMLSTLWSVNSGSQTAAARTARLFGAIAAI